MERNPWFKAPGMKQNAKCDFNILYGFFFPIAFYFWFENGKRKFEMKKKNENIIRFVTDNNSAEWLKTPLMRFTQM